MKFSNVKFQTSEYYHLYNRGVEKREIFLDTQDYQRFLSGLVEFNNHLGAREKDFLKRKDRARDGAIPGARSDLRYRRSDLAPSDPAPDPAPDKRLVQIIAYCVNPNHYHLILQPFIEGGVTQFMRKLATSYAMYFNTKYHRSGYLFQGKFKSSQINSFERLVWLSAYVNGNPEIHQIAQAQSWLWSSYWEYLDKTGAGFCDKSVIMAKFNSAAGYKNFADMVIAETQREKQELKEDLLE